MTDLTFDEQFMAEALVLAKKAEQQGEVPVGAVLVYENEIIGRGWNQSITLHDPTAHAEILALRDAGKKRENYRLNDCTLYVTLEPCPMCAGAMVHARLQRLVYGATDPRTGAAGSIFDLTNSSKLNHRLLVTSGILGESCKHLLQQFFQDLRKKNLPTASNNIPHSENG